MRERHDLTEEKRKKAVKAFGRAHPEITVYDWPPHCPNCLNKSGKRRPYCEYHNFAYRGWLIGGKGCAMIGAMAVKDQELKNALKAEGLWYGGD